MSAMFFLLNVAIGNSPAYIYSLTSFAFLEHQTSRFYHTSEANLVPLLIFITRIHIASFTSMFFPLYMTGHRYLIHKTGVLLRARLSTKKIQKSIPDWHLCYYPNGKEMDQMVGNDIACKSITLKRIAFWYTCI